MIRNYRIRKLFAPAAGLRKAGLGLTIGILLFALGLILISRQTFQPFMQQTVRSWDGLMRKFITEDMVEISTYASGGIFLVLGLFMQFRAARKGVRHMLETLDPNLKEGMLDVYVRRQQLAKGPRIVALGGGTGLSTLLRGLKQHSSNITAIVTVTDDGGSSGRLIQDKGMIPPGDIRNCLVALAEAEKSMTDLFQHRFKDDSGSLSGHSMGNLLIAALVDQAHGDFEKAIEIASDVLAIRGRVVPSTLEHIRLRAVLEDGVEVCGETAIVQAGKRIRKIFLDPASCEPYPFALQAIREADLIVIGPGSVYTSIIPNLLVPGIAQALKDSKAPKVYVCNVMTQPGESENFTASEHITALLVNVELRIFDYVLINDGVPSEELLEKYREFGQHLVEPDVDRIRAMGYRTLPGNFMSGSDFVRHDPMKVAARLINLLRK